MRKLYVNRIYTNLVGVVSDADRMKYGSLASISQAGHSATPRSPPPSSASARMRGRHGRASES